MGRKEFPGNRRGRRETLRLSRFQGDATATGAQPLVPLCILQEEPLSQPDCLRAAKHAGVEMPQLYFNFVLLPSFRPNSFLLPHRRKKLIAGQAHRFLQHESFPDRGQPIFRRKMPVSQASARLYDTQAPTPKAASQHRVCPWNLWTFISKASHRALDWTRLSRAGGKGSKSQP